MSVPRPLDGRPQPDRWLAEIVVFSLVATFALVVLGVAVIGAFAGA